MTLYVWDGEAEIGWGWRKNVHLYWKVAKFTTFLPYPKKVHPFYISEPRLHRSRLHRIFTFPGQV